MFIRFSKFHWLMFNGWFWNMEQLESYSKGSWKRILKTSKQVFWHTVHGSGKFLCIFQSLSSTCGKPRLQLVVAPSGESNLLACTIKRCTYYLSFAPITCYSDYMLSWTSIKLHVNVNRQITSLPVIWV